MAINFDALFKSATEQALTAAKGQAEALREYIQARAQLIANGAVAIEADRASGAIDDDDVKFAFAEIKATEATAILAVDATLKAAAQDAINAVLGVVAAAINQAIGVAVV